MKNRDIQSLRGLACLLLVFYHVLGSNPMNGLRVSDGWLRLLTDGLAVIRMPLFAFLGGAMYGAGSLTGSQLVIDKFKRLIVPMLTVGSLFAVVQYWTPGSNHQVQDLYLMHVVPVGHYWFLESLFVIFCLLALIERVFSLSDVLSWLVAFSASAVLYLLHPGFIWFGILGAIYLLPYFLLGLAFTRFSWTDSPFRALAGILLVAGAFALLAGLVLTAGHANRFSLVMLITGLMFSAGLWLRPMRSAWLARIGDYSFTIFLFHVFFTAATRMALSWVGVESVGLHIQAGVFFGLIGPGVMHHIILRSPMLRHGLLGMYLHHGHRATKPNARLSK